MAIGTVEGAMDALNHGLIRAINRYLLVKTPIRPAKLCFVFGTRRGVEAFACRISGLWRAGYFEHAIISGGVTLGRKEAEAVVLRRRLIELGVPDSVILVETLATNTGENVALSLPILDREIGLHRIESLIAVGKFCASRRYLMTLQRHWPDVVKMLLPIHYHPVDRSRWMEDDELRCRILKEWSKIELYRQKGYLAELQSETCCLL
jgi:hypothetical protein